MKQLTKKYQGWLLIVQLLCVMLLTLYTCANTLGPMIGGVYALAGMQSLAADRADSPSFALMTRSRENWGRAYAYGWSPASPATYFKLSQALMLQGDPEFAVTTLERAYLLAPTKLSTQGNNNLTAPEVSQEGVITHMVEFGDSSIDHLQYAAALRWYALAIQRAPSLQATLALRCALAAIFANDPAAMPLIGVAHQVDPTFNVYSLVDTLKINGPDFRWATSITKDFTYGTPLSYATHGDPIGTLWWTGEVVAAVLNQHAGSYVLSVRLRHSAPPPVQMAIGADRQQLKTVDLTRGDNSWETVTIPLTLSQGLHTINIWFLNNGVVGDIDRDAAIEWVTLQIKP